MRLPARWVIRQQPDAARVGGLAGALNLPPALASLLLQRGFETADAAATFLRPSLDTLTDPMDLPDLGRAVELIAAAVRAGQGILVHGDYDVDGQCATALLTRTLRAAGARVVPFVPHRVRDGYDFGPAGLAAAAAEQTAVIVTCDCGTTAHETVAAARERGHTVIVTDHHVVSALPPAHAVINPQREDCTAAYRHYCGTGVAFKLAQGLVAALDAPRNLPYHLLDLVALATVADIVPLTGENRVLVRAGLKLLGGSGWPGVAGRRPWPAGPCAGWGARPRREGARGTHPPGAGGGTAGGRTGGGRRSGCGGVEAGRGRRGGALMPRPRARSRRSAVQGRPRCR